MTHTERDEYKARMKAATFDKYAVAHLETCLNIVAAVEAMKARGEEPSRAWLEARFTQAARDTTARRNPRKAAQTAGKA